MKSHSHLPQGLYRSMPREVRLSGAGRVLAATAVLLCLLAPIVAVVLRQQAEGEHARRDALLREGVIASGVVTRLKREGGDDKRSMVYYQFEANGLIVTDREKIPLAKWRTLDTGSALPIRYLPNDPSVSTPDGLVPKVMPLWLGYVFAPILLVVAAVSGLGLRHQRRLLCEGRAAIAVVKDVKKHRGQHGSYYAVRYEFPLLNGAVQTGSVNPSSKPLDVGSSFAVLYDAERPKRSRPYPLSLVRLAESD